MSDFKYNDEWVEVKEEFKVYIHEDEFGNEYEDAIGEMTVTAGTKGEIVAASWSSADGFRHLYDVELPIDGDIKTVSLYQDDLEKLMIITERTDG